MDRVTKALRRLSRKRRLAMLELIGLVESGTLTDLQIEKLKGYRSLYKVRKGDVRLIVKRTGGSYNAVVMEGRSDTTYKDLRKFDG